MELTLYPPGEVLQANIALAERRWFGWIVKTIRQPDYDGIATYLSGEFQGSGRIDIDKVGRHGVSTIELSSVTGGVGEVQNQLAGGEGHSIERLKFTLPVQ